MNCEDKNLFCVVFGIDFIFFLIVVFWGLLNFCLGFSCMCLVLYFYKKVYNKSLDCFIMEGFD